MKRNLTIVVVLLFGVALVVVGVVRDRRDDSYRLAKELPAGALIYVQVADLPALIERWRTSELRRRYLASAGFDALRKRHLALKLADRAAEIESALGFVPNLDFAAGLAEKDAALAVYDIGRMEFVVVAPIGRKEEFASALTASTESFEKLNSNGVDFYAREIEVDRGRQRQKVFFTIYRRRFILATSEREFFRTIDILRGRGAASIAAAPSFRELTAKLAPHLATVWTDQRKLGNDWYFRHYFGHPDDPRVKNIRAALFDLDESDNALTERRVFSTESDGAPTIDAATVGRLARSVTPDAALATISAADTKIAAAEVFAAAFDTPEPAEETDQDRTKFRFYEWTDGMWGRESGDSDNVGTREMDSPAPVLPDHQDLIAASLAVAEPAAIATIFRPQSLPLPFVVDDRRAVVIAFRKPSAFDRERFERAVAATAVARTTVGVAEFEWTDTSLARELKLRGLGWSVLYAFRGDELVVSGNAELLESIITTDGIDAPRESLVRFARFVPGSASGPFNSTFAAFDDGTEGARFFGNTAGSLFEVVDGLRAAELTERRRGNLIFETVNFAY